MSGAENSTISNAMAIRFRKAEAMTLAQLATAEEIARVSRIASSDETVLAIAKILAANLQSEVLASKLG